jgi:hypothetical protein
MILAFGPFGYWFAMVPLGVATGATYGFVNEQSAAAVAAFLAVLGVAIVFEDTVPRIPAVRRMLDRFRPAEQGAVSCARDAP